MAQLDHPITRRSFDIIDREMGPHRFTPAEYEVVRRVIHATADFEFASLLHFSPTALVQATAALRAGAPIIVDVGMVYQGIRRRVQQTFQNPIWVAVDQVEQAAPGHTRTETGLLQCWHRCPRAIYVIGNAPTALLALCRQLGQRPAVSPMVVIGAPVGFVAVEEAKAALSTCAVPQIRIDGRKGGSSAAAAITNALLTLAWCHDEPCQELPADSSQSAPPRDSRTDHGTAHGH